MGMKTNYLRIFISSFSNNLQRKFWKTLLRGFLPLDNIHLFSPRFSQNKCLIDWKTYNLRSQYDIGQGDFHLQNKSRFVISYNHRITRQFLVQLATQFLPRLTFFWQWAMLSETQYLACIVPCWQRVKIERNGMKNFGRVKP
jgi:hypothetical protein